jgi:hypothetical protein
MSESGTFSTHPGIGADGEASIGSGWWGFGAFFVPLSHHPSLGAAGAYAIRLRP